jgi:hypothetical protein
VEVIRDWKSLQNNDPRFSPRILPVIKLRRMRGLEHTARMGDRKGAYRILVGKPEENGPLNIRGNIRLKWIYKKWNAEGSGLVWLEIDTNFGLF